jgi:hypothetical protein
MKKNVLQTVNSLRWNLDPVPIGKAVLIELRGKVCTYVYNV